MNSIGNFVTMQCSAGRLGVLAFKWMTLDPYHPPKHCHRPSSPPHGNSTGLPLRTQATTTATNLLGVVVVTMQASVITYADMRREWPENWDAFLEICFPNHLQMWCGSHLQKWLSCVFKKKKKKMLSKLSNMSTIWICKKKGLNLHCGKKACMCFGAKVKLVD